MKKLLCALLVATIFFTLAGCSTAQSDDLSDGSESLSASTSSVDPSHPSSLASSRSSSHSSAASEASQLTTKEWVQSLPDRLEDQLVDGEMIRRVALTDDVLTIVVKMATDTPDPDWDQTALSKASALTNTILAYEDYEDDWETIVVDFGVLGTVKAPKTMIQTDGQTRYFDLTADTFTPGTAASSKVASSQSNTNAATATQPSNTSSGTGSGSNQGDADRFNTYSDTEAPEDAALVGNSNTMLFHKPTCDQIKKIKPEHMVSLSSEKEAIANGFSPCGICHASPNQTPAPSSSTAPAPPPQPQPSQPSGGTVYWTPNGKSYHSTSGCRSLARSKTILSGTLEEAFAAGKYDPCNNCT